MKMIFAAFALAIAAPAAAQTAAGHDHAAHAAAGHAAPDAAAHQGDHAGHSGKQDHKGCCEKGADGKMACPHKNAEGKKMDCCKEHAGHHEGHAAKAH